MLTKGNNNTANILLLSLVSLFLLTSLSCLITDNKKIYSPQIPAIEATATYKIAIGGVASGRNELVIFDEYNNILNLRGRALSFEVEGEDVVELVPRDGYQDFASGSGALIRPKKPGYAVIKYLIDGTRQEDEFLVIVPPQSIIQMMVAEAARQITDEADVDENNHVRLTSRSNTAEAIGFVARNRVKITYENDDLSLFDVDSNLWKSDPPASYFDAVIYAHNEDIYQYSPVDPSDPTHGIFEDAATRDGLDESFHRAYDQAVLTAADIFSESIDDPTGGAFAFFSPTEEEWSCILDLYTQQGTNIPPSCGFTDSDFPSLAPIELFVPRDIWRYKDGMPSFVFARQKGNSEGPVVIIE